VLHTVVAGDGAELLVGYGAIGDVGRPRLGDSEVGAAAVRISCAVALRLSVTTPRATTVVMPRLMPNAVSSVRTRWRSRLRNMSTKKGMAHPQDHFEKRFHR